MPLALVGDQCFTLEDLFSVYCITEIITLGIRSKGHFDYDKPEVFQTGIVQACFNAVLCCATVWRFCRLPTRFEVIRKYWLIITLSLAAYAVVMVADVLVFMDQWAEGHRNHTVQLVVNVFGFAVPIALWTTATWTSDRAVKLSAWCVVCQLGFLISLPTFASTLLPGHIGHHKTVYIKFYAEIALLVILFAFSCIRAPWSDMPFVSPLLRKCCARCPATRCCSCCRLLHVSPETAHLLGDHQAPGQGTTEQR